MTQNKKLSVRFHLAKTVWMVAPLSYSEWSRYGTRCENGSGCAQESASISRGYTRRESPKGALRMRG